jgi:hypothetical protein
MSSAGAVAARRRAPQAGRPGALRSQPDGEYAAVKIVLPAKITASEALAVLLIGATVNFRRARWTFGSWL